jgi:hypothetical protein
MAIRNLFSKQQKAKENRETADYQYGYFPKPLRVQIVHIIDEMLKEGIPFVEPPWLYERIHKIVCKEYGVFSLSKDGNKGDREAVLEFVLNTPDVNQCLDIIQVAFEVVTERNPQMGLPSFFEYAPYARNAAIEECNQRFKEHNVGFQFVEGQILRIDSELTHQQITMPVLKLLEQEFLKGANEEFLSAQEHFRHGRYKECLNECLKSFESTMKAICNKRRWHYNQNDTAKTLITICEKNKLFPIFMESHLTGLRTTLESGVPTARNKTSGHGQGVELIKVSEEFAVYVLNLTATNIRFLAESEQALK